MTWIFGQASQTYLAEIDSIHARVWRAPARTWSARVITPYKDFWRHNFPTSDAAKAWCEAQIDKLPTGSSAPPALARPWLRRVSGSTREEV